MLSSCVSLQQKDGSSLFFFFQYLSLNSGPCYPLSNASSPFCFVSFWIRVLCLFSLSQPQTAILLPILLLYLGLPVCTATLAQLVCWDGNLNNFLFRLALNSDPSDLCLPCSLGVCSYKGTNPIDESPSWPNNLPKDPFPNLSGEDFKMWIWWGYKHSVHSSELKGFLLDQGLKKIHQKWRMSNLARYHGWLAIKIEDSPWTASAEFSLKLSPGGGRGWGIVEKRAQGA
jgi:hypothetical protein